MNNFHYHQDPLYSAAASILEGASEVQALVKDFAVGDNTNFGKVLEIGADSITFKAKDLPKTRITFNQRKMGSSEFLLTKLIKLKEETEASEEMVDEAYKPLRKPEDLVAELQTIIDAPDAKLWDVTSVSLRLSHEDIFDRFPKIYDYVEDMWEAIMTPDGARKTKEIAKKAIEAVHKYYPIKEETEASEETLDEEINWLGDYLPTSEKSKFGGYLPMIINKKTKGLMYQSAVKYNTPQEAKDHAEEYLKQKSKGIKNPKLPHVGTYKEETEEENIDEETEIDKLRERLRKYPMRMRVAQAEGNSEMVKFYQDQKKKVEARIAELRSKKTNEEVTEAVDPATKRRKQLDMARVNAGAMSRDDYNKKYKLGKYRPVGSKLSGPGGVYKNLVKEVLNPDDEAGVWIDDFVKSDDPRFEGKSKEERIKMALGAWYAAQKKESTESTAEALEEATMTAAEKKMAQEVHDVLKDGEQVGQAYGMWIRSLHNRLTSKFGKDWRKIAGIKEETVVEDNAETLEEVVALPSVKKVIDMVDEMSPKEYSNFLHALADNAFGIAVSTKRIKPNGPSNSDAWEDVADGIRDAAKAYDARPVKMSEGVEELEEAVYPMTKKALEATFNLDPDEFEELLKELARKLNEMGDKTNYKQWYEVADHMDKAHKTWKKYAWDDFSDSF